ncbi:TnsA endonuclease N-terminal domain-containing protein [Grimontia sp. SpTr1]|uniref:TnsA endonuclease N-terminal domain-containing protein n=1 Tax=Grimontia sp. SpTr1 TaxID=2995319 RepID=UPI00248BA0F8|nr:TnsA endonuclease N-terminal domain-containing protein [Grimontia sp. SpTr1]
MFDQTNKASFVHNIRKFMSLKNDAVVRTMSVLEYDFCLHLEYNPDVHSYVSQPDGFFYHFNGRKCRYTPDFQVFDSAGTSAFFEVKHSSKISSPDFKARFEKKARVADELGHPLVLVTEKQIRLDPIINNLKLLHRYSGLHTITEIQKSVLAYVRKRGEVKLYQVADELGISEHETLICSLCWISSKKINADLRQEPFSLNTLVWCDQ